MADVVRINGRYRLDRPLGSGAGGRVFRVLDGNHGDVPRALKCVDASDEEEPRLVGEFRRLAAMRHPNLVQVFDLERAEQGCAEVPAGSLFFVAEQIEGEPLAARHLAGDPRRLIEIASDIASALAELHAGGLVHCDVKPDNILVEGGDSGRAVLVDLGLSGALGESGARGTPLYMAPEALAGAPEPASDVFGLALSLRRAITGAPPREGNRSQVLEQIRRGSVAPIEGAPWLPEAMRVLLDRWSQSDPRARPSSGVVALRDLARVAEGSGLPRPKTTAPLGPPPFVGRERPLAELGEVLRRARDARQTELVELCGPAGVGKRSTLSVAIRRAQVEAALSGPVPVRVLRGDCAALARAVGATGDSADLAEALNAAAGDGLDAVAIEDDGPEAVQLFAQLRDARTALLAIRVAEVPTGWGRGITLSALDRDAIASLACGMVGASLPDEWLGELWRASTGLPGIAADIVRAAAATGESVSATRPAALIGSDHTALLVARAVSRPADEVALLEVLAVFGGSARVDEVAAVGEMGEEEVFAAAGRAAAAGLCAIADRQVTLASSAQCAALRAAVPTGRSRDLHRSILRLRQQEGEESPLRLWVHEAEVGSAARATRICLEAVAELTRQGRSAEALSAARSACDRATGAAASRAALALAEAACTAGDYETAEESAERAMRSKDADVRGRGRLLSARSALKRGALARARKALEPLVADREPEAMALLARVEVGAGHLDEALRVAAAVDAAAPAPARAVALEASALAHVYAGDTPSAELALDAVESIAAARGDRVLRARSLALRGICDQAAGRTARAAQCYAVAAEAVRETGNLHAAAVYDVNCATAESHRGRHGNALRALDRALPALERTASPAELSGAWFNRGIALLALGELESAGRAAERAMGCADERSKMHHYARLLAGDVARRQGDFDRAHSHYQRVAAGKRASELPDLRFEARLNLAELAAARGDVAPLTELATVPPPSEDARSRLLLARGRAAIALGLAEPTPESLAQQARELTATGRDDLAWRAAVVAARLYRGLGQRESAAEQAAAASEILDAIAAETPEELRSGLRRDPDRQALIAVQEDLSISGSQAQATEEPTLRRLFALARRLNSELRLQPLLDDVIDTVIELSGAERGFLLLRSPAGELEVTVARNFDRAALEAGSTQLSRSIAERAAVSGELVVTLDAGEDERWTGAESVAAMNLRSVLAVPLRDKSRLIGTVYLDHRYRAAAFDNRTAHLVREVADLAAVAISNARLAEENRCKQREILELNTRLSEDLERAQGELIEVRNRLPGAIAAGFDDIVGRSAVMLDLFAAIERAAAAEVPVVVRGPSGSGKELVARAIHKRSARRAAPFVALNCGAVPTTLMESELFGHARGAFTGAHRDRRGLFELADGGILFLDEIADTDPAMQAKLLRVLQEGELRRVGDTEVRKVDVRVVCASQRALAELVDAGKFREDLYYRLQVLEIVVPPLRDRREDIPELAEHILGRLCADPPAISADAMARLVAYDWPGNVRELENELARALAMSGGERIETSSISVDSPTPASPGDSVRNLTNLAVRPRLEALERALVEEALRRTSGNQSQAARLLGLSRFGLQKKLKRYGMAPPG